MGYLDPRFRIASQVVQFAVMLLGIVAALAVVYAVSPGDHWIYWATFILPVPCLLLFYLSLRLWQQGANIHSPIAFLAGSLFICGGLIFDLAATVHHSPDLTLEGNPLARNLLDLGFPLEFVFFYGFALQGILALVLCVLWAAFLRHRTWWLETSLQVAPHSFLDFLKATTGGGLLPWRQYLFYPLPSDAKPSPYHMGVFLLPPGLLAAGLHRWYVGLEWFGVVPWISPMVSGVAALAAGIAVSTVGLYLWFRHRTSSPRLVEASA